MKRTMRRWYSVFGGIELTVETSPAPVADHRSDAPQPAFDHASEEPLPAGRVLAHALVDRDDLAPALRADADGDEDARALHVPAPGSLVPHAVHEHVRVLGFQRAFPPLVDLLVDLLEFVAQCPGWHPLAPQQPAGVVHPACAHAREAHLHQRLLDAGFAPPAALDHRRPEHGVVELYDFIGHGFRPSFQSRFSCASD